MRYSYLIGYHNFLGFGVANVTIKSKITKESVIKIAQAIQEILGLPNGSVTILDTQLIRIKRN